MYNKQSMKESHYNRIENEDYDCDTWAATPIHLKNNNGTSSIELFIVIKIIENS